MIKPTVSIIIITRNRPFLLGHCLERLWSQPYEQKELIVVDSSSDDKSERVVARYPRTTYIRVRGERDNMPQARNRGIACSMGEIIAFIDDDSMVQPEWLDALVDVYGDETIGAAGGRVIAMPEPYCDEIQGPP